MSSVQKRRLVKILLFVALAWFLLIFIRWITSNDIHDSAVDAQDGNVAILNNDYELKTYDVSGQLLSTIDIDLYDNSGGYAFLEYVDGKLYVTMLRTDVAYVVEADNKMVLTEDVPFDAAGLYAWDNGWDSNGQGKTYTTAKTVYKYNYPSFWRYLFGDWEISFEVTDAQTQKTVVIWSFDENK